MAIIYYNGKFVTTAKSLETNMAVVTRVDCIVFQTGALNATSRAFPAEKQPKSINITGC
jgi:hypothetical protein